MKKMIAWLLILATLLLAGCQRVVDPSNPTSGGPGISADPTNKPTEPRPTDPIETKPTEPASTDPIETQPTEPAVTEPTDPQPTDPAPTEPAPTEPEGFPANMNTDEKVVQKFQKLFDNDSWFTQALNEEFDDPRTINLVDFLFPGGGDDPWPTFDVTKEEMEEVISKTGPRKEWESGWYRMDAKTVEEVLQTVFGVTFSEFINSADKYLRYLESTDSYYVGRSDCSLVRNVSVSGIRQLENGNIEVYYTCKRLYPKERVVTLKPVGDSYIVISNKGL